MKLKLKLNCPIRKEINYVCKSDVSGHCWSEDEGGG